MAINKLQVLVDKARLALSKNPDLAFITALARFYKVEEKSDHPTAATDGLKIYFNLEWAQSLSDSKFMFIYLHEIGHNMLYHCTKRGERVIKKFSHEIANIAMDHCVNNMLMKAGLTVPDDATREDRFIGKMMEEVAEILWNELTPQEQEEQKNRDNPNNNPGQGGSDIIFGAGGDESQSDGQNEAQKKAREEQIYKKAQEAIQAAENIVKLKQKQAEEEALKNGTEPGSGQGIGSNGLDLELSRGRRQPTDWSMELRHFVGADSGFDYVDDWSKIHRKFTGNMLYAGRQKKTRPHIGVILDTSGSMYTDLPDCIVELEALSAEGFSMDLITCDGSINSMSFESYEFMGADVPIRGGGGSDMAPAFEAMKKQFDPECIVFITDCMVYWPDEKPDVPLLVLQTPSCGRYGFERDSDFPNHWFPDGDDEYRVIKKEDE